MRRIAFTDSVVAFAHVGGDKMLDVIPLEQVTSILDCDGVSSADTDEDIGRILLEIVVSVFQICLMIKFTQSSLPQLLPVKNR